MGTPWVKYRSVHQLLCTDTGQSSDPSSPVGSHRAKSGFNGKPPEPDMARRDPTSPDGSLNCPVSVYD